MTTSYVYFNYNNQSNYVSDLSKDETGAYHWRYTTDRTRASLITDEQAIAQIKQYLRVYSRTDAKIAVL